MVSAFALALQVVDTAELFSFKRQRKLSLRFLAAFLLHIDIQSQVRSLSCVLVGGPFDSSRGHC